MKKIFICFVVISGLFFASSCSNDFDLVTDWKDIPVVYGLISTVDTAHYIRVEKAFLDPKTSALVLAQVADSIYYPNATVKLVRTDDNREYVFTKVDGNLEGYKRVSGTFADSPNWLYKLKTNGIDTIRPETEYQLIVNRDEDSEPVTSTIETITNLEIRNPNILIPTVPFYNANKEPIGLSFRWVFNPDNTVIFNANLTFNYDETIDGVAESKSFVWSLASNLRVDGGSVSETIKIETNDFYREISNNIEENVAALRTVRSIELEVIGGGTSFGQYIDVNQANSGLTSSQVIPNFTNMSEGYGLFSSVHFVSESYFLDLTSRDSLRNGQFTKLLNFQ